VVLKRVDQAVGIIVVASGVALIALGVLRIVASEVWWAYALVIVGLFQIPLGVRMFRVAGRRKRPEKT
jgi:hypothetical protein